MDELAAGAPLNFINIRSLNPAVAVSSGNDPACSTAVYAVIKPMGIKGADRRAFSEFSYLIASCLPSTLFLLPSNSSYP